MCISIPIDPFLTNDPLIRLSILLAGSRRDIVRQGDILLAFETVGGQMVADILLVEALGR